MVGPSRRGGPCPGVGCGRRDRCGRGARASRLPRASRAGGGVARPAEAAPSSWPPRRPRPAAAAGRPPPAVRHPNSAALTALAWAHLEHNELSEARSRLTQARAALSASPDKLLSAVACLAAATGDLAEGHPGAAAEMAAKARCGWSVPPWLEHRLTLVESHACAAAGDIRAALAAAERSGRDNSPEAAVTLARAWAAAGDGGNATRALAPALAAGRGAPERVQLQAWLVDARLSYDSGDHARGRRSLAVRAAARRTRAAPAAVRDRAGLASGSCYGAIRHWPGPTGDCSGPA